MIFKQWQDVLDGVKTQTRRVLKPGEQVVAFTHNGTEITLLHPAILARVDGAGWSDVAIHAVNNASGRSKHVVGREYPIIPKRAEMAVGSFLLEGIRVERLQVISQVDAKAEAVADVDAYRSLWESINGKEPGSRWEDNPVVLVYELSHRNMNYRTMLEELGSK
jgi:hypothetical protein